ncbi:hypothetical protein GOP47_0028335 [Adiantum capillus-veneris]|nr:hypothetical protein GOP47_0028335 [Adiantum capillus-veneris]
MPAGHSFFLPLLMILTGAVLWGGGAMCLVQFVFFLESVCRAPLELKIYKSRPLYTKERPRFGDHLEAIKFICKDFWAEIFKKQVDNLKTNHRGVFVLQDNRFRWLTHISLDSPIHNADGVSIENSLTNNAVMAARAAGQYLYFPCGLIRGALTNLGVPCDVSAEVASLPACSFIVRIKA